ncbi:Bcr/CflA family efflux MFS transporter [Pseudomonas donghuensis]|uniref:Bcr/CflA family efflux transporter n=2 Tax=Pseudomonas TaxID=286 RepID=A0AAP0SE31_9PSED|nr:Bcr/CflA family efflux MFS transporter [Pseudomonas donghuensis]MBS7600710.1 Bcr/CflA family efflux MFS transporter [Pseudomonas sp. RC2C2]KDN98721.2 Bcr/CflA family efflux MFS transporter [Pseudomonas donghuensis]MCP6691000.1 Bcr/CflA family efflux MFS transporter [Pseudomonas donghuensis]MCP6696204.1 Bcr/CflA family efflux MFS transporter [Pseudomonas donghuensis]UVL27049.1 Bcr/CflA family efflux MFS transporter [Pseudomonas donghuensis]
MMTQPTWLTLATALLMFPQIAETLYSPALVDIGQGFGVTPAQAGQTLSLYFAAFAVGVLVWGRLCDLWGRRPALLAGLLLYSLASLAALLVTNFTGLLGARVVAAFAAAVGSVVTQTALRDVHGGAQLARVFSLIGIFLAISPAIGVLSGSLLTEAFGYRGVLTAQLLMALALLLWSWQLMPETRPQSPNHASLISTLRRMLGDRRVLLATLLVALFNIGVFSWYSLAPFIFQRLQLQSLFGYSGVLLALGSLLGARLNARLLARGVSQATLLNLACAVNLLAALAILLLGEHWLIAVAMAFMLGAFAMAIPLLLGSALVEYGDCRGTAGALFGLMYYGLIGAGLNLAGEWQALGVTLVWCAALISITAWGYGRRSL